MGSQRFQNIVQNIHARVCLGFHTYHHGTGYDIHWCCLVSSLLCLFVQVRPRRRSEHWKHRLLRRKTTDAFKKLAQEKQEQVAADLVLVFHNPDYEYSDKYDAVTQAALERCFVSHQLTHMPKHLAQEL